MVSVNQINRALRYGKRLVAVFVQTSLANGQTGRRQAMTTNSLPRPPPPATFSAPSRTNGMYCTSTPTNARTVPASCHVQPLHVSRRPSRRRARRRCPVGHDRPDGDVVESNRVGGSGMLGLLYSIVQRRDRSRTMSSATGRSGHDRTDGSALGLRGGLCISPSLAQETMSSHGSTYAAAGWCRIP